MGSIPLKPKHVDVQFENFKGVWEEIKNLQSPFGQQPTNTFGYWFNYFWNEAVTARDIDSGGKTTVCTTYQQVCDVYGGGKSPVAVKWREPEFAVKPEFVGDPEQFSRARDVLVQKFVSEANSHRREPFSRPLAELQRGIDERKFAPIAEDHLRRQVLERKFGCAIDNYWRLKMLRNLLHVGFEFHPYRAIDSHRHPPTSGDELPGLDEVSLGQESPRPSGVVHIAYRADTRNYETLKSHRGFQARARADADYRAKYALDEPWHPYSLEPYRNGMFFRKGSNYDNCVHTVVSIGLSLEGVAGFPVLKDADFFQLPLGPINEGEFKTKLQNCKRTGEVRINKDELGSFIENDTWVYVLNIDSGIKGLNTAQRQGEGAFSERAVNQVPFNNIIASVLLTRKYWWDMRSLEPSKHGWELFGFSVAAGNIRIFDSAKALGKGVDVRLQAHLEQQVADADRRAKLVSAKEARKEVHDHPQKYLPRVPSPKQTCNKCKQEYQGPEWLHKTKCKKVPALPQRVLAKN